MAAVPELEADPEPEPEGVPAAEVVAEPTVEAPVQTPVETPVLEIATVAPVVPIGTSMPVRVPAAAPAARVYGILDRETPAPADEAQYETPIFRSLHSNWLGGGNSENPWASSEVEAGWEAAGRVAANPPPQLSDAGLPMRRPGNRLVPGGVAPATAAVVRDPEAIRARLAAHAAGVSRGRSAIVETVPADSSQKEAGLA